MPYIHLGREGGCVGVFIDGLNAEFQWFAVLYGIECSFLVVITQDEYECVIAIKLYEIPYHTANNCNEACNTFLPHKIC